MSVLVALLQTLRTWARSRAALQLEVLALRHQLHVLQRSRPRRLRLAQADRWLWVVLSRVLTGWRTALVIVKPGTDEASGCGGPGGVGAGSGGRPCPLTSAHSFATCRMQIRAGVRRGFMANS